MQNITRNATINQKRGGDRNNSPFEQCRRCRRQASHIIAMARLQPETITDQRELAIIHVYRARMSERVKRPNKFELIVLADGMVFDSRLIVKDETPKLDLRERSD